MRRILAFVLCVLLLTVSAYAASLTSVEINQVLQSEGDLYVAFHANDENGEGMAGLSEEDVRLEIGGEILDTELQDQSSLGIGYVFAVDVSASLSVEQFAAVKEQMKAWAGALGAQDRMAIVTFGSSVTTVTDFTGNANTLNAIIDGLQPLDATTMLYSGVLRAVDLATRQGSDLPLRRAVVLLSDGVNETTQDAVGMQEMRDKAVEAGVPLYIAGVVGDGNGDSLAAIGEMARATGGVIYTGSKDELGQCFEKLSAYIGNGFLVKAQVPAAMTDGSQKGLILSVTSGGTSANDSADLRLKAVTAAASTSTPEQSEGPGEQTAEEEPETAAEQETEVPAETAEPEAAPTAEPQLGTAAGKNIMEEYGLYIYIGCGALLLILIVCCIAIPRRKKKKGAVNKANKPEPETEETEDTQTVIDPVGGSGGDRLVLTDTVMSQSYSCALKDRITIGRRDDNDIVIRDSRVSGSHCEIIRDNGRLYVRDAGSRNGTRVIVNGVRYQVDGISGQEVQVGDEIEVGHTRLEITEA